MCTGLSEICKLENKVNFLTVFKAVELHKNRILIFRVLAVTAHKLVYS